MAKIQPKQIQQGSDNYVLTTSSGSVVWAPSQSTVEQLNDLSDVTMSILPYSATTQADDGKMLFFEKDTNQWIVDDTVTHGTSVINGKSASGTITKGTPLYLVGFDSDLHTVLPANATSSATMPCIGLAAEEMDTVNSKHIMTFGKLQGVDTTSASTINPNNEVWDINDDLYVDTTAGGLTKVRPTGAATQIQRIAKILKVGSTDGQLLIFNTARTAGLPNLTENNVWIGNVDNQPVEATISSLLDGNGIYDGSGSIPSPVTVNMPSTFGIIFSSSTTPDLFVIDNSNNQVAVGNLLTGGAKASIYTEDEIRPLRIDHDISGSQNQYHTIDLDIDFEGTTGTTIPVDGIRVDLRTQDTGNTATYTGYRANLSGNDGGIAQGVYVDLDGRGGSGTTYGVRVENLSGTADGYKYGVYSRISYNGPGTAGHFQVSGLGPAKTALYATGQVGDYGLIIPTNNVNNGIGTSTPTANLHIENATFRYNRLPGDGYILTSDANGNASWQLGTVSGFTSDSFVVDANLVGSSIQFDRNDNPNAFSVDLTPLGYTTGTGTPNYVTKWNTTTGLTDSIMYDDGTTVSIGTTTPNAGNTFFVSGNTEIIGQSSVGGSMVLYSADGTTDPTISYSGTNGGTIHLEVQPDGKLDWYGDDGLLFSIEDDLTGLLFSVNDISGLPVLEAYADDRVIMGSFGENSLVVNEDKVFVGTQTATTTNSTVRFYVSGGTEFDGDVIIPANATNGYVLTSDANGVATWQVNPGATGSTDSYVIGSTLNGTTLELSRNNGLSALTTNLVGLGYTTGTGTPNYVPKWASTTGLTDSLIYDDGTTVHVNATVATETGFTMFISGDTKVIGHFEADTKSFDIPHPSDPTKRLRHGSLEGPEFGVYYRGKSTTNIIELPSYWKDLVDEETITVQVTAFGKQQNLYVGEVSLTQIEVLGDDSPQYFYNVYGERKDIDKLTVEY